MSPGLKIGIGAVAGLAIGIGVSVVTDLPLMPELGLVLGGLAAWAASRS